MTNGWPVGALGIPTAPFVLTTSNACATDQRVFDLPGGLWGDVRLDAGQARFATWAIVVGPPTCGPKIGPIMRILVVEDEASIAAAVSTALSHEGYAIDIVADGRESLDWAAAYPYDLVILDVVLPGLDGFTVCRALRDGGIHAPILMLTALDEVAHRVAGLDSGADDYLAKPFAMPELLARVRALLRRRSPGRAALIRIADLEIDPSSHEVRRAGALIRLTAREFAVLEVLARNAGQVFSQERIIEAVWDAEFAAGSNIVEVYIRSLRRKIDGGRRGGLIETIRGAGYRLRAVEP
jgi:DNA-binding response OmpR family regulator